MFIYRNETDTKLPDHHFLKVILKGDKKNTAAIGAKVTAIHNGNIVYLEQMPMRGFKSTVDFRPNLGLGLLTVVDSLIVEWPDDRITVLTNVPTNQILTLQQSNAKNISLKLTDSFSNKNLFFEDISDENRIKFIHKRK